MLQLSDAEKNAGFAADVLVELGELAAAAVTGARSKSRLRQTLAELARRLPVNEVRLTIDQIRKAQALLRGEQAASEPTSGSQR
jgi:hypothetical protein